MRCPHNAISERENMQHAAKLTRLSTAFHSLISTDRISHEGDGVCTEHSSDVSHQAPIRDRNEVVLAGHAGINVPNNSTVYETICNHDQKTA